MRPKLINADVDKPKALSEYHNLLLSILRVITAVVLSRGPQNEQTLEQARRFLVENRSSMVAIFKRQAKIVDAVDHDISITIEELIELYIILVSMTGFMDVSSDVLLDCSCHLTHSLVRRAERCSEVIGPRLHLRPPLVAVVQLKCFNLDLAASVKGL